MDYNELREELFDLLDREAEASRDNTPFHRLDKD